MAGNGSSNLGAYTDVSMEAWSNGVPILDLDGNWSKGYERRSGTQRAYVSGRAEVGALFNGSPEDAASTPWRLGVLARADGTAKVSGQAGQILYHYQSRTDPDQPGTYNADTQVLYWVGQGLALHTPTLRWGAMQVQASWDHMSLSQLRSQQTSGWVSYHADGSYGFQGLLRDDSNRTTEIFMAPAAPHGVGDAMSVALTWGGPTEAPDDAGANWQPQRVSLKVDDLWSRLSWAGINGNDAVLDSNVSQRTPEGYIEYRAAINGRYTRRTVIQRIPVVSQVQLEWDRPQGTWSLSVRERVGLWQSWLGWQSPGEVRWRVALEPRAGAVSVGAGWRGLNASLMTSRLDNGAHARGGQLSWAVPF